MRTFGESFGMIALGSLLGMILGLVVAEDLVLLFATRGGVYGFISYVTWIFLGVLSSRDNSTGWDAIGDGIECMHALEVLMAFALPLILILSIIYVVFHTLAIFCWPPNWWSKVS